MSSGRDDAIALKEKAFERPNPDAYVVGWLAAHLAYNTDPHTGKPHTADYWRAFGKELAK